MAVNDGRMTVGHLRLRGAEVDPLSARLRVESLLGGIEFSTAGLPPSAILFVRRLRDPRPGTVSLRRQELRPPAEWEQALSATLRELLPRAARPALGSVPDSAEVILFTDSSELLACLASDVCGGLAVTRWWWRSLYRDVDLWRQLVKEWSRLPEYVPAALEFLSARGEAQALLRKMGDADARALLVQIAERYGLRALSSVLEGEPDAALSTRSSGARVQSLWPPENEPPAEHPRAAPWDRLVPEARWLELSVEQRLLLGVALLLRRAPGEVSHPAFASAVAHWRWAEERAGSHARPAPMPRSGMTGHGARPESPVQPEAPSPQSKPDVPPGPDAEPPSPQPEHTRGHGLPPTHSVREGLSPVSSLPAPIPENATPSVTVPLTEKREASASVTPAPASEHAKAPPLAPPLPGSAHASSSEEFAPTPRWTGAPIHTGLGGLFYLLNLGIFLELYGDFTAPSSPGLSLPVWDFVTLLGRRLLVDVHEEDPSWELLARLAGREPGTPPGSDFMPPDAWRVPASWVKPFREPGLWSWTVAGHEEPRLRVLHPSGFLVLDVPAEEGQAEAQTRSETAPLARIVPFTLAPGFITWELGEGASPLERWLGWLVPYVRARLARALGEGDSPAELSRVLLEHEARVHVTEAHVDVVFSLESLPLPIRFAGLDRNIGWLPAAGRHVMFHFD